MFNKEEKIKKWAQFFLLLLINDSSREAVPLDKMFALEPQCFLR